MSFFFFIFFDVDEMNAKIFTQINLIQWRIHLMLTLSINCLIGAIKYFPFIINIHTSHFDSWIRNSPDSNYGSLNSKFSINAIFGLREILFEIVEIHQMQSLLRFIFVRKKIMNKRQKTKDEIFFVKKCQTMTNFVDQTFYTRKNWNYFWKMFARKMKMKIKWNKKQNENQNWSKSIFWFLSFFCSSFDRLRID